MRSEIRTSSSTFAGRLAVGLVVALSLAASSAFAQWRPTAPVRFIVGYAPGGATDQLARVVAAEINKAGRLGQPVIVENKAGAGGLLGADYVAKAPPDGHIVCVCSTASITVAGLLGEKPQYDPVKDFAPLSGGWSSGMVMVVRPDLPVNNIQELVAYAKANPGKLNVANIGTGSPTHLGGELFKSLAGVSFTNVPYKGEAEAIQAVSGGFADVYAATVISSAPGLIKNGRLRAIATFSSRRTPMFPDLPTIREQGYPTFNSDPLTGFNVAAATPPEIAQTLSREIQSALRSEGARRAIENAGMIPLVSDPQSWGTLIAQDRAKWAKLIKDAGIKAN